MKWLSRKLFVMLLTNAVFAGFFILTLQQSPGSITVIGNTLILTIGFFNAAYCGTNVLDKFVQRKKGDGDDGK